MLKEGNSHPTAINIGEKLNTTTSKCAAEDLAIEGGSASELI